AMKQADRKNVRFLAVIAGAIVCLGLVPVFEKLAVDSGAGLFTLVIAINVVTVICLAAPAWRQRPQGLTHGWRSLLLIGAIASGVVVLLNLWALETTTASHRSVFQAMYPATTAVFAFWLLGERLPLRGYLVIAVMVVGIIIMSGQGLRLEFVFGDLLLMLTLPMMGLCDAWARRSLTSLSAEWVAFGRFFFGTFTLLGLCLISGNPLGWPPQEAWLWILLSGISIGLGIILLYRGMALKGASVAAALIGLSPVITLVLEWLFLAGRFTPVELLGMLIVTVGGILLGRRYFQETDREEDARSGVTKNSSLQKR
ncbi:MAG: DMT family transporter, partial [Pseudohongiellaceae bacterium]